MQFKLEKNNKYQCITTIDAHTEGEPLRIITSGFPEPKGNTILEKRRDLLENHDHLRKLIMFEPRGHADMYGALITKAERSDSDFGILFMHNEGYSSMCGHGIIASVATAVETGDIQLSPGQTKTIAIDSPAGKITAYAKHAEPKAEISFDCVPSFAEAINQTVHVEGYGEVTFDISFGGAYYAYVDADAIDVDCTPENVEQLIQLGRAIKHAVMENYTIRHPEHADLSFLYGTIFTSSKTTDPDSHSRHVCIFADGEVDRSPTGTGVSGRIALLVAKGEAELNDTLKIESIISSNMRVTAIDNANCGDKVGVIPRVSGRAYITGQHEFLIDPEDPINEGFILR